MTGSVAAFALALAWIIPATTAAAAPTDEGPGAPGAVEHNFWVVLAEPEDAGTVPGTPASATKRALVEELLENTAAIYDRDTGWDWSLQIAPGTDVLRMSTASLCENPGDDTRHEAAALFPEAVAYNAANPEQYFDAAQTSQHLLIISVKYSGQCYNANGYADGGWATHSSAPNPEAGGIITLVDDSWDFGDGFATDDNVRTLAKELGRNLGLGDSGVADCVPGTGVNQYAWDEEGWVSCGYLEDADRYDFMGGEGSNISPHQTYRWGMLDASKYTVVSPASWTQRFTLSDKDTDDGALKLVVIPTQGGSRTFFVEHRRESDSKSGLFIVSNQDPTGYNADIIKVPYLVYRGLVTGGSGPYSTYSLGPGQTYTFGGVSIYLEAVDNTSSIIQVKVAETYLELSSEFSARPWHDAAGGTMERQILTSAASWTAAPAAGSEWLDLSATSGKSGSSLTLTAGPNHEATGRIGQVNVTADGITKPIYFYQLAQDDCGDTSAEACTIALNATGTTEIVKSMHSPTDTDWMAFTAPTSGTWTFEAAGQPLSTEYWANLLDSTGAAITGTNIWYSAGTNLTPLEADLTAGQTYYLRTYADQARNLALAIPADPYTIRATAPAGPAVTLSVSPETVTLAQPYGSTSEAITVTTDQEAWNAVSNQAWLVVTKAADSFTVRAISANITGKPRTATVTVSDGNATPVTVAVTQEKRAAPPPPSLAVSPDSLSFASAAGSQAVTVTTNQSYWMAADDATWITLTQAGTSLTVRVTANTTAAARTGTVTVLSGAATPVTVVVTQEARTPVAISSVTVTGTPAVGQVLTATVGATTPTVAAKTYRWYRGSTPISGATAYRYTLKAADVGQQVKVVVTATASGYVAGTAESDPVTVEGAQLAVSPTSLEFGSVASTDTVAVTTNQATWYVVDNAAWLTVTKSGDSITVRATANNTKAARTATITVWAGTAPRVTATVTVTQASPATK
jgi:hypothetical protein